ncbi:MAG: hypothetical protein ACREFI_03565 [Stellaceae bacterium]
MSEAISSSEFIAARIAAALDHEPALNLWAFASAISPRRVAAYLQWHSPHKLTAANWRAVDAYVASGCELTDAVKRQFIRKKKDAWRIFAFQLPQRVREELLTERYSITGRRDGKGDRVAVTADDFAGLGVDLKTNSLRSRNVFYSEIAIRPREPGTPDAPLEVPAMTQARASKQASVAEVCWKIYGGERILDTPKQAAVKILPRFEPGMDRSTIGRGMRLYEKQRSAVSTGKKGK